jgi:hypothetical protein
VWKLIDVIQSRLRKKVLRLLRFAANVVAELEMDRNGRRGKVLCLAVKYWLRILSTDL